MVNIDVPAGVGAPPLDTQLLSYIINDLLYHGYDGCIWFQLPRPRAEWFIPDTSWIGVLCQQLLSKWCQIWRLPRVTSCKCVFLASLFKSSKLL